MKPCQSHSPAAVTLKRTNAETGSSASRLRGGVNRNLNTAAPTTCTARPLAIPTIASASSCRSSCAIGNL
eukprot:12819380-Alexandrium_andersonii.AAC.1